MSGERLGSGTRAIHGPKYDNERMVRLADARPPAHDSANPWGWPALAAIRPRFQLQPFFPASFAYLGGPGVSSYRAGPLGAWSQLAGGSASRRGHHYHFGARLHHRSP